jgi:hypothetical protein
MKGLKHEPDLLAAESRELILAEFRDVDVVDEDRSAGRRVEPCDEAEQR